MADDDFRVRIQRHVQDLRDQEQAADAAWEERQKRQRDFLVEFREKMEAVVEPVLAEVYAELQANNVECRYFPTSESRLRVSLTFGALGDESSLDYDPHAGAPNRVHLKIHAPSRSEHADLEPKSLTEKTVRRHVEALFEVAKGRPLSVGWAGSG